MQNHKEVKTLKVHLQFQAWSKGFLLRSHHNLALDRNIAFSLVKGRMFSRQELN